MRFDDSRYRPAGDISAKYDNNISTNIVDHVNNNDRSIIADIGNFNIIHV